MKPVQKLAVSRFAARDSDSKIVDGWLERNRDTVAVEKFPGHMHRGSLITVHENMTGDYLMSNCTRLFLEGWISDPPRKEGTRLRPKYTVTSLDFEGCWEI